MITNHNSVDRDVHKMFTHESEIVNLHHQDVTFCKLSRLRQDETFHF